MLTHRNLLSNVAASQKALPVEDTDVALSVLPYSHVFERLVAHYLYANGGATVALADGQEKLLENLGEIRPTIMTMVPRFYEKVYAGVMEKVAAGSALKQKIFHWAVAIGREHGKYRQRGEPAPALLNVKYALASRLAFASCTPASAAGCGSSSRARPRSRERSQSSSGRRGCRSWRAMG